MRLITIILILLTQAFAILANDDLDKKNNTVKGAIYPLFDAGEKIDCPSENWKKFRAQYTDNVQKISVYGNGENNFTVIVSEPPPNLSQEDFSNLPIGENDAFFYCDTPVGEDGRKRDVVFNVIGKENAAKLVIVISKKMYGKYILVSKSKNDESLETSLDKVSYNLEINSGQLLQMVHFAFGENVGTINKPKYDYFDKLQSRVIEPKEEKEGIILFKLDKSKPIKDTSEFKEEFRLFSLKTDLLIGAFSTNQSLLLIGRKRKVATSSYPPMRYETLLRIAKVAKKEKAIDKKIEEARQLEQEFLKYQQIKKTELNKRIEAWCNSIKRQFGEDKFFVNQKEVNIVFSNTNKIKSGYILYNSACIDKITKKVIGDPFYVYEKDDNPLNSKYYSDLQMDGGLLNQSFERQRTQKLSSNGNQYEEAFPDITPNYLSDYTNDTEIGQLLTIADMHLKGGSEEGKVEYQNYRKFVKLNDTSVFEEIRKLGFNSVIYNWNGKGKFTRSKINKLSMFSISSTGAMNASFIVLDGIIKNKKKIDSIEKKYNERFKNSGSYTLANVVKYNFLKDVFKDNNISLISEFDIVKPISNELKNIKNVCTKVEAEISSGKLAPEIVNRVREKLLKTTDINESDEEEKIKILGKILTKVHYEEILSKGKKDDSSWIVTPTIIRSQNRSGGIGGHNNDVPLNKFTFKEREIRDLSKNKLDVDGYKRLLNPKGLPSGSGKDDDSKNKNQYKNEKTLKQYEATPDDSEQKNEFKDFLENNYLNDGGNTYISNRTEKIKKLAI